MHAFVRATGTRPALRGLCTSTMVTLTSSSGEVHNFPVAFVRENINSAWDPHSLQRVDNQMWDVSAVLSSEPLTPSSWRLTFNDGAVGDFHLPPTQGDVDIEDQSKVIWGGSAFVPGDAVSSLLSSRAADGGIRFSWDELQIDEHISPERAASQLGEGRANISRDAATARAALIEATHRYGIAMIDGVPTEPNMCIMFADATVGAVETTNFGYKFVLKSVEDPINLAYDSIHLQHHTDVPYCRDCPDLALFHCLSNADEGGDSLWLDGFACAEELRRTDPAAFALLTRVQVRHMDKTDKWDLQASATATKYVSTSFE